LNTVRLNGQPVSPSKIVCVGRNYVAHIEELGNSVPDEMVVFLKPNSAIANELQSTCGEPLHYEGEICLMVENGGFSAVAFGLDLTRRALQAKLKAQGLPWERAKAFDGAALFSEFVPLPAQWTELSMELDINGATVQRGDTGLMLYRPDAILAEILTFMSLNNGDIVMTGTPKGVGPVTTGDRFSGRVLADGSLLAAGSWMADQGGSSRDLGAK